MGVRQPQVNVPDAEIPTLKKSFRNLAAIASNEDGAQLNFRYEYRADVNSEDPNAEIVFAKKREGIAALSVVSVASTHVGRGLFAWRKSSATTDTLLYALDDGTDTKIYIDSSGTGSASRTLAGITDKDIYFVPVAAFDGSTTTEKLFVITTGVAQIYDGSSWANSTSTPLATAKLAAFYKNMMFAVTTGNANRVNISDVGKPDTFTSGNAIDFPGAITGLRQLGQFLVVFTANSIHLISGSQPSDIVVSSANRGVVSKHQTIGADSQRSVQEVLGWLYFWNKDRIFRFNTQTVEEVAYDKMRETFGTVVKSVSNIFAGQNFNNRYYLSVTYSTGTTNNRVICYDPHVDNYSMDTVSNVHSFTTYRSSTNAVPSLVYVSNSATSRTQKVYTYNGSTTPLDVYDGSTSTSIAMQYTSEHMSFGDPHMLKRFRYLYFSTKAIGSSATAKFQLSVNRSGFSDAVSFTMSAPGFTLGTSRLNVDSLSGATLSTTNVSRIRPSVCLTLATRFYDTQSNGQTEFYDFDLEYQPKKLKKR